MEFSFNEREQALQKEVRSFLAREMGPQLKEEMESWEGSTLRPRFSEGLRQLLRRMGKKGWFGIPWPKKYGGQEGTFTEQYVVVDEMTYQGVLPDRESLAIVGPDLLVFGSEEHKREFLPSITRSELVFCIGYSEPGFGSDLGGAQTRAVEDGDDYVITGQKIFTSRAHEADFCWLLARTDPQAPKHKGLSVFLVPMKSPGITIRPLINMADIHYFNEVFFDQVRVPKRNLVGEKNRGWYHVATALDFERTPILFPAGPTRRALDRLVSLVREGGLARRPGVALWRQRLAELAIEVEVLQVLCYRVVWLLDRGKVPNFESSMIKLFGTELSQRVAQAGMGLMGLYGPLLRGSPRAFLGGLAPRLSMVSIPTTIAGGTSEVQRNIIAQRGLGLPR